MASGYNRNRIPKMAIDPVERRRALIQVKWLVVVAVAIWAPLLVIPHILDLLGLG